MHHSQASKYKYKYEIRNRGETSRPINNETSWPMHAVQADQEGWGTTLFLPRMAGKCAKLESLYHCHHKRQRETSGSIISSWHPPPLWLWPLPDSSSDAQATADAMTRDTFVPRNQQFEAHSHRASSKMSHLGQFLCNRTDSEIDCTPWQFSLLPQSHDNLFENYGIMHTKMNRNHHKQSTNPNFSATLSKSWSVLVDTTSMLPTIDFLTFPRVWKQMDTICSRTAKTSLLAPWEQLNQRNWRPAEVKLKVEVKARWHWRGGGKVKVGTTNSVRNGIEKASKVTVKVKEKWEPINSQWKWNKNWRQFERGL